MCVLAFKKPINTGIVSLCANCLREYSYRKDRDYISELFADEAKLGQGIGTKLSDAIQDEARDRGRS